MKFKRGDILVESHSTEAVFVTISMCKEIKIRDIVKINNTFYYTLDTIPETLEIDTLFPQISIDDMYDLDILQLRKNKVNKIKNAIKK